MLTIAPLTNVVFERAVRGALWEDLGRAGDLTTAAVVPADMLAEAVLVARGGGVVAGLDVAVQAFRIVDPAIEVGMRCPDGATVTKGDVIATISGPAHGLLTAERVALNFLCHLSGIATITRAVVDAVRDYPSRIACTRKTTPGLRALEKYAVRVGGGSNHRFGLDDAVLIKDNHIAFAGGVRPAIERAKRAVGHLVKIEIEVETLDQLREALSVGVDAVLLDNMGIDELAEAVKLVRGQAITEASGGITLDTAPTVAATGVDFISIGWLTHSAPILDVGLDVPDGTASASPLYAQPA